MDWANLKIVAQVAGVAGVALGVFLTLYRDVIRKQIFPMLTKEQAFRLLTLLLVLVWTVALAGIGAWVWISLDKRIPIVDGRTTETHEASQKAPDGNLLGTWLVTSTGALPEGLSQEMKKNQGDGENTKKSPENDSIGDLGKAFGELVQAASQPGSFLVQLKGDNSYKISEKSGIFKESNVDSELLSPSGNWTFTQDDNRLLLIPVGAGKAAAFKFKTIEKDRMIVEDFGGRSCVFVRQ